MAWILNRMMQVAHKKRTGRERKRAVQLFDNKDVRTLPGRKMRGYIEATNENSGRDEINESVNEEKMTVILKTLDLLAKRSSEFDEVNRWVHSNK